MDCALSRIAHSNDYEQDTKHNKIKEGGKIKWKKGGERVGKEKKEK